MNHDIKMNLQKINQKNYETPFSIDLILKVKIKKKIYKTGI